MITDEAPDYVDALRQQIFKSIGVPEQLLKECAYSPPSYWIKHSYGTTLDPCIYEYKCAECSSISDIPKHKCSECGSRMCFVVDEKLLSLYESYRRTCNEQINGQISMFD